MLAGGTIDAMQTITPGGNPYAAGMIYDYSGGLDPNTALTYSPQTGQLETGASSDPSGSVAGTGGGRNRLRRLRRHSANRARRARPRQHVELDRGAGIRSLMVLVGIVLIAAGFYVAGQRGVKAVTITQLGEGPHGETELCRCARRGARHWRRGRARTRGPCPCLVAPAHLSQMPLAMEPAASFPATRHALEHGY